MRHRIALFLLVVASPACAMLLGVEDGTPRDASVEGSIDAASEEASSVLPDVSTDEAAAPPPLTVRCGAALDCVLGAELCCRTKKNNAFSYACVTDGGACTGVNDLPIVCDRQSTCAQDAAAPDAAIICCGDLTTYDSGSFVTTVLCETQAKCLNKGGVPICGEPDAACPATKKCAVSVLSIPGYFICQ